MGSDLRRVDLSPPLMVILEEREKKEENIDILLLLLPSAGVLWEGKEVYYYSSSFSQVCTIPEEESLSSVSFAKSLQFNNLPHAPYTCLPALPIYIYALGRRRILLPILYSQDQQGRMRESSTAILLSSVPSAPAFLSPSLSPSCLVFLCAIKHERHDSGILSWHD